MQPHGNYAVYMEDDVLVVRLSGMFDEQATTKVCELIYELIQPLQGKAFKMLVDCLAYQGSTPEAHQISNQHLIWLNQQQCVARATVFSQPLHLEIVKNQQPAAVGVTQRKEFTCLKEAKLWLSQQ